MDRCRGEKLAEGTGAQQPEADLQKARHHANAQRPLVTQDRIAMAELLDGAKGNDDKARGGSFNGQLRV